MSVLKFLQGKKTYIIAAIWAVVTFLYAIGSIDQATYLMLQGILLPSGLATLRAGVEKGGTK